jgi:hypothetical protein
MFGMKGEEVTGDWRELHNNEVQLVQFSMYTPKRMRWAQYVAP